MCRFTLCVMYTIAISVYGHTQGEIKLLPGVARVTIGDTYIARGNVIILIDISAKSLGMEVLELLKSIDFSDNFRALKKLTMFGRCSSMLDINSTLISNRRPKRALIDLGGKTLRFLFGTATLTDLRAMNKKFGKDIDIVGMQLRNLFKLQKSSRKALGSIQRGLGKLDTKLSVLETEIVKLNIIQQLEMLCNSYMLYRADLQSGHINMPEIDLSSLNNLLLEYQVRWGLQVPVEVGSSDFEKII